MQTRTNIDRLIINAYALLFALIFVYFYQQIVAVALPGAQLYTRAGVSGIFYALSGCLVCMIPVVCVLGPSEDRLITGVIRLIWFQTGRLATLFVYALAGEFIFRHFKSWQVLNMIIAGSIMVLYGVFILWRRTAAWKTPIKNTTFFLWGTSLGYGCSVEATAFLLPLWVTPDTFSGKAAAYFLFSLMSILVPLVVLFPLLSVKNGKLKVPAVIRETGNTTAGIFLILLGLLMLGGLSQ